MIPFPNKKYQIIYADPPWKLKSDVKSRSATKHYPTMTLDAIKKLPIPADNNAALYLWATIPMLPEALEVMYAWGFKYKSHMIWDKEIIGCGWWFRGQHELLLVGTKGKFSPPINSLRTSGVFREKRTKHSKKPKGIRDYIKKWFPNANRIELFARERTDGWDVWGNEVSSDISQSISKKQQIINAAVAKLRNRNE